jgi:chorismate-pyruvate lyase|tara:strand:+ start:1736 stop:1912 length:177 start_codon:yes stop_codon:yes gene_type:complete
MNVKEMADIIASWSNDMVQNSEKQMEGNKAAGKRLRKASIELRKACKVIRQMSLDLDN